MLVKSNSSVFAHWKSFGRWEGGYKISASPTLRRILTVEEPPSGQRQGFRCGRMLQLPKCHANDTNEDVHIIPPSPHTSRQDCESFLGGIFSQTLQH